MKKKGTLLITIPIVVIVLLFVIFKYHTEYAKKEIDTYYLDNSNYKLVIYSIGDPVWPFGPQKGKLVLWGDGKKINESGFTISNDGKNACSANFTVSWGSNDVQIIINGEEQEDITYKLFFDGTISVTQ